jgi:hypothetical protein
MIFRLMHGGVRENLALTPTLREWKTRKPDEKVLVETSMPELFVGNPCVDEVGTWFEDTTLIDLDVVEEPVSGIHPVDLYALIALGDMRLGSRRMEVFATGAAAPVGDVLVGNEFSLRHEGILKALQARFGSVSVIRYDRREVGVTVSLLVQAKLFVGCDEDATWLAMTTDVPMVMCCGPRLVRQCRPFRAEVPFEAVTWKCDLADSCARRFSSYGFGNMYYVHCPRLLRTACEALVTETDVMAAVDKVLGS